MAIKTFNVPNDFDPLFGKYAAAYGLDPYLLKAIAWQESNLNPQAVGDNGNSKGMMQINVGQNPQMLANLGEPAGLNLHDPDNNIRVAAKLIRDNRKILNARNIDPRPEHDAAMYNGGPNAVSRAGQIQGHVGTYVFMVLGRRDILAMTGRLA